MKCNAIAFLLTFLAFTSSPYQDNNTADIAQIFNNGKIQLKQATVSGWAKLQEPSGQALESTVKLVSEHMEAKFGESEVYVDDGLIKRSVYHANYKEGSISLKIEDKYNSLMKKNETVIIIDITQYGKLWNITDIGERVTKCVKEIGSGPSANICIEGYVDGEVSKLEREKMMSNILTGLEASRVESINTNNLMSICGYTSNIKDYIKSKYKRINVNIASRYSVSDSKTYFWIGTPVLNIEY